MSLYQILFNNCVLLLEWIAESLDTTYIVVNIWIFCIIWPLYTIIITWLTFRNFQKESK